MTVLTLQALIERHTGLFDRTERFLEEIMDEDLYLRQMAIQMLADWQIFRLAVRRALDRQTQEETDATRETREQTGG